MTKEELTIWFESKLAEELGKTPNEISLSIPIEQYHLDSISLVSLSQDLEDFVGFYIEPTIFSEFETINEIIEWILSRQKS
ncbi:acyl carrier protein [Emticicia sp. 21SJ11W-3]|uniref:acyl carrier protein n=1 Tax=Emticicia sp. 21SJ11W-3 TaxID=2916755 RepID=UPI00209CA9FA|nr:acyl carrier protein [Emticicia sp. 21SJ11W-3]UTA67851.1 acyl carrier protein [Emticicia sp. 21SJ11W-3]